MLNVIFSLDEKFPEILEIETKKYCFARKPKSECTFTRREKMEETINKIL